eukprot:gnl/TRDRNA2_/TRDRNA2_46489_c0_seq1.p1 gnl/TRDRNA2_/TRDRNA2_46489_c0~~gnl/TRDRNA2_/TRDRNA2_46489_c0_seq1.p1  ORF type:complete len:118 (-),score=13.92 gnl/TRDRNA2_/TRDRNA2_46489_c0_seq1:234-587(-)
MGWPDAGAIRTTATNDEIRWHVWAYMIRRGGTTLSKHAAEAPQHKVGGTSQRPTGFVGTWAPLDGALPPGHTNYSWLHEEAQGMSKGFATTWAPGPGQLPPGHTVHSWELALSATTA